MHVRSADDVSWTCLLDSLNTYQDANVPFSQDTNMGARRSKEKARKGRNPRRPGYPSERMKKKSKMSLRGGVE